MSIQNQIERINNSVSNAYSAIVEMNGTIPEIQNIDNLAESIRTIPKGGAMIDYQEDEHVIGTWINGKLVYRQVYYSEKKDVPRSSYVKIADLPSNIDIVISLRGAYQRNGVEWCPLGPAAGTNDNFVGIVGGRNSDSTICIYGSYAGSTTCNKIVCIIEYTKTTD